MIVHVVKALIYSIIIINSIRDLTSVVGSAFVFRDEGPRFDPGTSQVYAHCV